MNLDKRIKVEASEKAAQKYAPNSEHARAPQL